MPPRAAPALLLALLLLPLNLPAEAGHAVDPSARAIIDRWLAHGKATVQAAPFVGSDTGLRTSALGEAEQVAARGTVMLSAPRIAALHALSAFANMTAQAPVDNGSQESRRAQKLWWLNRSAEMAANATTRLAAARSELSAFEATTAAGWEWGVLAGRALVSASVALEEEYPAVRQQMEGFAPIEPDTRVGVYRTAAASLVRTTAGASVLTEFSRELVAEARRADARPNPAIQEARRGEVMEVYLLQVRHPTFSSPNQGPTLNRALYALEDGEEFYGLAAFHLFSDIRTAQGLEGARDRGSLNQTGLARARAEHLSGALAALNATAGTGLPGILLRDALSGNEATGDAALGAGRLDAGHAMHTAVVRLTQPPDPEPPSSLPLLVGGLAVAGILGFLIWRRRQ